MSLAITKTANFANGQIDVTLHKVWIRRKL